MIYFQNALGAQIREAADPVGVRRHCARRRFRVQEIHGRRSEHLTTGVTGSGRQGKTRIKFLNCFTLFPVVLKALVMENYERK